MATKQQVDNLVNMLDGYVEKGGHHLNVNVFNRDTLLDAQKHKLADLLGEENFDSNLSETENMIANRYFQIYDCGNLKMRLVRD